MLHPLQPLGIATELKAALLVQRQALAWALTPTKRLTRGEIRKLFSAPWTDWMDDRFALDGSRNDFVSALKALRRFRKKNGNARSRILRAFDHDITFDALNDPAFAFHYHTKLSTEERKLIRPLMEGFYDWLCSPGLPRVGGGRLTRDVLIAEFWLANPNLVVCPACDHRRPDGIDGKVYADCDHYLPKSIHPFLAIHPANLLPTCLACNRSFKLANDPLKEFGAGRVGETFLPYHRPAFGPLTLTARRQSVAVETVITDPTGASKRRASLCRVFKLQARWSSRLGDISKECDSELAGWPNMMRRNNLNPDRVKLGRELIAKASHERDQASRKESALVRRAYYEFVSNDASEFSALCIRLGL